MVFNKNKKGQAAIEFLMTYGWMLLVVLIVGALIFSFVDFGSLLPNRVDLSNTLRGDPTGSIAYSKDYPDSNNNTVLIRFKYNGAKRAMINYSQARIITELDEVCVGANIRNLKNKMDAVDSGKDTVPFLGSNEGILTFNCSPGVSSGLLTGDSLVGSIRINVLDPKSGIAIPSSGSIRLTITN